MFGQHWNSLLSQECERRYVLQKWRTHLGIPVAGVVSKVYTCFEQVTHFTSGTAMVFSPFPVLPLQGYVMADYSRHTGRKWDLSASSAQACMLELQFYCKGGAYKGFSSIDASIKARLSPFYDERRSFLSPLPMADNPTCWFLSVIIGWMQNQRIWIQQCVPLTYFGWLGRIPYRSGVIPQLLLGQWGTWLASWGWYGTRGSYLDQ